MAVALSREVDIDVSINALRLLFAAPRSVLVL